MNPEMAPEELQAMMAQGQGAPNGNGGQPDPQPEQETSLQALDAAVKATANAARSTAVPGDAKDFAQAAFFLAQATAKLVPPPDPNEQAKVEADREKTQVSAQVDRERIQADAEKAAADREAQKQQARIKVERDGAGLPTAYVKGGN